VTAIAASQNHSPPGEHNFELLSEFSVEMRVVVHHRSNLLGILSVALSACSCVFAFWNFGPDVFTGSSYYVFVPLAILIAATISAIAAAQRGSKWWLLVLIWPFIVMMGVLLQWLIH